MGPPWRRVFDLGPDRPAHGDGIRYLADPPDFGLRRGGDCRLGAGKSFQLAPHQTVYTDDTWAKPTRSQGLQFKKAAAGCRDILLWSDGTVAAGMRPLGAGWVVSLGAGVGGPAVESLLAPILEHFGVRDRVPVRATSPRLYTRHYISNSGLHDVWVMYNESGSPVTTDLLFRPGYHPGALSDVVSGQSFPIIRDLAGDRLRNITLKHLETRMWISPRPDVAASPLEWLGVQRDWWHGTVKPDLGPLPTPAQDRRFSIDLTEGWHFKPADGLSDAERVALTQPGVDDSSREQRGFGIWSVSEHPTGEVCRDAPRVHRAGAVDQGLRGIVRGPAHRRVRRRGPHFRGWPARQAHPGSAIFPRRHLLGPRGRPAETGHVSCIGRRDQVEPLAGRSAGQCLAVLQSRPAGREDLSGTWARYTDPLHAAGSVQLPGPFQGQYASRRVTIDRRHARQT